MGQDVAPAWWWLEPAPSLCGLPPPAPRRACRYILQTYARPEIVFAYGEGAKMYDVYGKEYLDFAAGIAVNALGELAREWIVQPLCGGADFRVAGSRRKGRGSMLVTCPAGAGKLHGEMQMLK